MTDQQPQNPVPRAPRPDRGKLLPGVAGIAMWMLALALIGVVGVLHHAFPSQGALFAVLPISTLLALAGLGLLQMRRWGWAIALASVLLMACYYSYTALRTHQLNGLFMAVIDLLFFLYLMRPNVRERLR
ncbi:MAG: hypothetical protein ACYC46_03970 [Acidobacteriaceae bacterium]